MSKGIIFDPGMYMPENDTIEENSKRISALLRDPVNNSELKTYLRQSLFNSKVWKKKINKNIEG